jgi:molecular chaperone DnaJ
MAKRDFYEVLGVGRQAAGGEIRRAYRRLARQYSPDINVWDDRCPALFGEIAEAYAVLNDPAARAMYDRLGHRAFGAPGVGGGERPPRGEDLHYPIEIDLEQALRGVSAAIEVTRRAPCPACGGSGGEGGGGVVACPSCGGHPLRIAVQAGDLAVAARCQACAGTGRRLPPACPACGGRGTAPRPARITVRIPPGVDTGAQVRVPGEGHAAPAPGEPGDLVVITRVRPHAFFTRKGDNLYCEVPLSVPEAALGARIPVPTPDGPAALTVPPGTQSGQILRLRGKGCPRLDRDGRGDLFVAVRVTIPRNADTMLEHALRALERLLPEDPRAELWGTQRSPS